MAPSNTSIDLLAFHCRIRILLPSTKLHTSHGQIAKTPEARALHNSCALRVLYGSGGSESIHEGAIRNSFSPCSSVSQDLENKGLDREKTSPRGRSIVQSVHPTQ